MMASTSLGKESALRTRFAVATGDIAIDQDADLEYDPQDFPGMVAPAVVVSILLFRIDLPNVQLGLIFGLVAVGCLLRY